MTKIIENSFPPSTTIAKRIVLAIKGKKAVIAFAIANFFLNDDAFKKEQAEKLIQEIKEMAQDNYVAMREVMGKELLTDIINYRP